MERSQVELGYLKKLVVGLKTLKEEQFKYKYFVSEFDKEKECGTVCCAWGWMPKFVPESGVEWECSLAGINLVAHDFFIEIKQKDVDFMFYGHFLDNHDFYKFGAHYRAKLPQVINRIEHVISLYEEV